MGVSKKKKKHADPEFSFYHTQKQTTVHKAKCESL